MVLRFFQFALVAFWIEKTRTWPLLWWHTMLTILIIYYRWWTHARQRCAEDLRARTKKPSGKAPTAANPSLQTFWTPFRTSRKYCGFIFLFLFFLFYNTDCAEPLTSFSCAVTDVRSPSYPFHFFNVCFFTSQVLQRRTVPRITRLPHGEDLGCKHGKQTCEDHFLTRSPAPHAVRSLHQWHYIRQIWSVLLARWKAVCQWQLQVSCFVVFCLLLWFNFNFIRMLWLRIHSNTDLSFCLAFLLLHNLQQPTESIQRRRRTGPAGHYPAHCSLRAGCTTGRPSSGRGQRHWYVFVMIVSLLYVEFAPSTFCFVVHTRTCMGLYPLSVSTLHTYCVS